MAKPFGELEEATVVKGHVLVQTLKDHAEGGWSVTPQVFIRVYKRTELDDSQRAALFESAKKGVQIQTRRGKTKAAQEFEEIMRFLDQ